MICPKCRAEYREGFYRCAECDVPLIGENQPALDALEDSETSNLVAVLETKDSSFLSDVVTLIEEEGIPYIVYSGTALGLESFSAMDNLIWRAVLSVPQNCVEQVDSLVSKVKLRSDRSHEQPEDLK
jgi:hypothetical protein